jgi:hypothetical protein
VSNLNDALAASYANHPRFRFDQPAWELEPTSLAAFNDAFSFLQAYGAALSPAERDAATAACIAKLAPIFAAFESQAADAHERQFAAELGAECGRLARRELAYYGRAVATRQRSIDVNRLQADALQLQRERHCFGRLSEEAVREILAIGASNLATFRARASEGRLTREDLSVNGGPVTVAILHVLNREYARLGILDSLALYTGRPMRAMGVALELSVAQARWWTNSFADLTRAPRTLYAHIDESVDFPKSIVYLTDVDRTRGPTSCYPGAFEDLRLNPLQSYIGRVIGNIGNSPQSPLHAYYERSYHQVMSSERARRHFMRLPAAIRFNSHLGWDVLPESDAERDLAAREKVMLGERGTFLAFDGAQLLHRGGMLEQGERIALQVVFGETGGVLRRAAGKALRMTGLRRSRR